MERKSRCACCHKFIARSLHKLLGPNGNGRLPMDDLERLDLKITRTGREYRGVPREQILRWRAERRVLSDDLVRPVGATNWMKVSLAPELASPATPATALPPPLPPISSPSPSKSRSSDSPDNLGIIEPAKSRKRRPKREVEDTALDMTPMIDVTFQLLIFFMLTNTMAHPTPIKVPVAEYGRGVSPDGMQTLVINEQGEYFLGDSTRDEARSPSLEALVGEVTQNAANVGQPLDVIISAHQNARHVSVRELLERLESIPNVGVVRLGVEEKR